MSDKNEHIMGQEFLESKDDLETFANRKIAELTARVNNLKELWRSNKEKDLGQEIAQIEQILADFEVNVRGILQAEEVLFPEDQKKSAIENLAKDSEREIDNIESRLKAEEVGLHSFTEKEKSTVTLASTEVISPSRIDGSDTEQVARTTLPRQDKKEASIIRDALPVKEKDKQRGQGFSTKKSLAVEAGIESAGRLSVEQKNTPEYKKAQEYSARLQAKIADIIGSLKNEEGDWLKNKLNGVPQEFWFFCKDMAVNDMEGFDYQAKVDMMEKHFQKTLAEVDKLSAEYRSSKSANQAEAEKTKETNDENILEKPEEIEIGPEDVVEDKASEADNKENIVSEQPISADSVSEEVEDFNQGQLETLAADIISEAEKKIKEIREATPFVDDGAGDLIEPKEKWGELDNILTIFKNKIGQILVDDELNFEQRKKEIEDSVLELDAKLELIKEKEDEEFEKETSEEILENEGKSEKKRRKGFNLKNFKEVFSNSEQRRVAVKAIYDTIGAISGYKFAGDVVLGVFVGKGDIYNYLRQKTEIKKEKRIVKESLVKGEKDRVKQVIEDSKNISPEEKQVLLDRLESLDQKYQEKSADLEEEKKARVQEELDLYIQNKIKGVKIAKDAANLVLMQAGFGMLRGGSYLLASMIERSQKASVSYKKEASVGRGGDEAKESKNKFILRDLLANSTRETFRALSGKGKTKESRHKTMDRLEAIGTLARAAGIAYFALQGETLPIGKLLDDLRERMAGGAEDLAATLSQDAVEGTTTSSSTEAADDLSFAKLDSADMQKPDLKMATAAAESTKPVIPEKTQILEDMQIDSSEEVQSSATAEAIKTSEAQTADSSVVEQPKTVSFEKKIDSSQVRGADSIWRSARTLFRENAQGLGYTGDLEDSEALAKWAENQTANAVAALNQEQGGNLADLVHDGDTVKVELVDGEPKLIFEASSGIEAGHLSDTNVGKMFEQTSFAEGVEHELKIDTSTGDQYLEVKTEEGVYKIYDWDRDGRPDVISPDGSHQEMSSEKLSDFLAEKNISQAPAPEAPDAAEIARQARLEKIEALISKGEGSYSSDLFAVAKEQGQLDELFRSILAKGENEQASAFVRDYFQDNDLSDNKRDIFLFELKRVLTTEEIKSPEITMDKMLASFDSHTAKDFDTMAERFGTGRDSELVTINVNGQYAIVKRVDAFGGAFGRGSESFYIDTNGDNKWDLKIKGIKAMKEIFAGKKSLIKG
ncbi:MAG: hypothetical protein PHO91_00780 [Patescibacteria group bacterium]|nr:hypothetical protein [Patescibacteria group bacterium]